MANRDLSAEYGIAHRGLALESSGGLERSGREGLFHRQRHSWRGNDPPLLRLPAAASRSDSRRWHGYGGLLAINGCRRQFLLKDTSLSFAIPPPPTPLSPPPHT